MELAVLPPTGVGESIVVSAYTRLLEELLLDRFSLQRRRLLPLWRDLATACSEIVYLGVWQSGEQSLPTFTCTGPS